MFSTGAYAYLDIDNPICAWATYRGILVSASPDGGRDDLVGGISVMSASLLESGAGARLNNELAIESIRRQRHPGRVSRLRGMYCFLDRESAERAGAAWGDCQNHFRPEFLAEFHLETTSRKDRLDSNWITYAERDENGFLIAGQLGQFDEYWAGRAYPGKEPIWETILEGRMVVLGTDLRERAYDVIRRTHPRSVALLEIARLAACVGSDLGNLRAWLRDDGDQVSLHYLQDMRESNDPDFLRKLEQLKMEGHPINWRDLHEEMKHGSFGKTMDLRPHGFSRAKDELPFLRATAAAKDPNSMTAAAPDAVRMAGRISAIENLLGVLVCDFARLQPDPVAWIRQYIANLRRGGNFISQHPLPEDIAGRLREETHKAFLEIADLLEIQLQELIRTGQVADRRTGNDHR